MSWFDLIYSTPVGSEHGPNENPVPCDVGYGNWRPTSELCKYCEHSAECAVRRLGIATVVTEGVKKPSRSRKQKTFEGVHGEIYQVILNSLVRKTKAVSLSFSARAFADFSKDDVVSMFDFLAAQAEFFGSMRKLSEGWLLEPKRFRAAVKALGWK